MISRILGVLILAVLCAAYVATREHAPFVHVRWRAEVPAAERASRLRQYDLRNCESSGETDICELLDTSRSNLAAIVGDRAIEDTYNISRAALRVPADADRAMHVTWVLHRTPLRRVPWGVETLLAIAVALLFARRPSLNVALALVALMLFFVLAARSGRIDVNNGLGYDGVDYAEMVRQGLRRGTEFTRLRPLVVVLAWIPYYFTQDVLRSFWILNSIFVVLQAYASAKLADVYGITRGAKTFLVLSFAVCIATAKMFAYYPVLIDLGAGVALLFAVYAMVRGPRRLAMGAVCVAVLARELAIGAALFGIHRDLRRRTGVWKTVLTYAPSIAVAVVLRRLSTAGQPSAGLLTRLSANIDRFWSDPLFISLLLYFVLTTFGGISLMLIARSAPAVRLLRDEPEWISFAAPVVVIASLWSVDMWRFLVYLSPLVVAAFARASREWSAREQAWLFGIGAVATWYTQQPLQHLDLRTYFRDWFPYFHYVRDVYVSDIPADPRDLLPIWAWRFGVTLLLLVLLSLTRFARRSPDDGRDVAASAAI